MKVDEIGPRSADEVPHANGDRRTGYSSDRRRALHAHTIIHVSARQRRTLLSGYHTHLHAR